MNRLFSSLKTAISELIVGIAKIFVNARGKPFFADIDILLDRFDEEYIGQIAVIRIYAKVRKLKPKLIHSVLNCNLQRLFRGLFCGHIDGSVDPVHEPDGGGGSTEDSDLHGIAAALAVKAAEVGSDNLV